jgi:hypothetical protein
MDIVKNTLQSYDNLNAFSQYLKQLGKENIEIEIIEWIAKHKCGIDISHAHTHIEGLLINAPIDRDLINTKLAMLTNEKYIKIVDGAYKFNNERYTIEDISYIVEKAIKDGGVAVSSNARDSLKRIMQQECACVYLFMAVTPVNYFKELLNDRIQAGRNTVVFFPHKKCVNINANTGYEKDLITWSQYQKDNKATDFFQFYLINNKNYEHLYSSCLTENVVRFNYFEYREDGKIRTGIGRVQIGEKDTSFYEMIMKKYEKAFYERIPILKKNHWKEYITSLFRRHLIKSLIFTFVVLAIVSYPILEPIFPDISSAVSSIFVLFTMIMGFLQSRISDNLKRKKLKF